jgi:hypothetical protein
MLELYFFTISIGGNIGGGMKTKKPLKKGAL